MGYINRFAVRAGAKHVIGVDMSTIIGKAKEIVERNGMTAKITLLQGKMEEVTASLPTRLISFCRNGWAISYSMRACWTRFFTPAIRYLNPGGLIFPDKASIFMAGIEDGEYKDEKIGCTSEEEGRHFNFLRC